MVEQQIARAPQDMDVRAWRACVLAWAGKPPEAEKEYLEILKVSRTDPDNWMGLASVYLREGRAPEAQRAISTAEELDPKRSDNHAPRARILRAGREKGSAIGVSVGAPFGSGKRGGSRFSASFPASEIIPPGVSSRSRTAPNELGA